MAWAAPSPSAAPCRPSARPSAFRCAPQYVPPSFVAVSILPAIRRIASSAMASARSSGLWRGLRKVGRYHAKAHRCGGGCDPCRHRSVSSGSQMHAMRHHLEEADRTLFRPSSVVERKPSDLVDHPAAVGTGFICGSTRRIVSAGSASLDENNLRTRPLAGEQRHRLPRSIGEPPPTAINPSQPEAAKAASASRRFVSVGFSAVSLKMAYGRPPRLPVTVVQIPASMIPGSVMMRGREMPSRDSSASRVSMAPAAKLEPSVM